MEEKAALDAKIASEVKERLRKIEQQFKCKTPKSSIELMSFSSPSYITTDATTSVPPPRPPPPGRPPPPKISTSHSMGDLAQCNHPIITTVEQTPLLSVETGVLGDRALSSYDVRNVSLISAGNSNVNPYVKKDHPGAPPNFLMPESVSLTQGSSTLSLYESTDQVDAADSCSNKEGACFPGPPSNCSSFYDLTEPVAGAVATRLSSLSLSNQNQRSANNSFSGSSNDVTTTQPANSAATNGSSFLSIGAVIEFDDSNPPSIDTRNEFIINGGVTATDFHSNRHFVNFNHFDDNSVANVFSTASDNTQPSSLDAFKSNNSSVAGVVPPPLPPKSEKHKRPIPFPLLK